jgi:hypothetical protein
MGFWAICLGYETSYLTDGQKIHLTERLVMVLFLLHSGMPEEKWAMI